MQNESDARLRTVVGARLDDIERLATRLDVIAKRMVGVQAGCSETAMELRRICRELNKELYPNVHTSGE